MSKVPLVCTAPLHFLPDVRRELSRRYRLKEGFNLGRPAVERLLGGARALITNPGTSFRFDASLLAKAPQLSIVVTPSTGRDHIDLDYCAARGIAVEALRGHEDVIEDIHASAEFSFALLLAMIRRLPAAYQGALAGRWREVEDEFRGIELSGKRVALVGYGRIGRKMARYCLAFGADVMVYDPFKKAEPPVRQARSMDEALAWGDVVCLHVHLDPQTKGMMGRPQFAKLRPGAYFLNTARGGLVDEAALLDALKSGRLSAAAVDVIEGEQGDVSKSPLIRHARKHPNLLVTPHIAGLTVDSQRKAALFALRTLDAHFRLKEDA